MRDAGCPAQPTIDFFHCLRNSLNSFPCSPGHESFLANFYLGFRKQSVNVVALFSLSPAFISMGKGTVILQAVDSKFKSSYTKTSPRAKTATNICSLTTAGPGSGPAVTPTCYRRARGHGHGHQPHQVPDGLGRLHGPHQLKGDGGHDGGEEAVAEAEEEADDDDALEPSALRDHHAHDAEQHEGCHLGRQKWARRWGTG